MRTRASSSGIVLGSVDAAIIKSLLRRGDRQHDIAAWFGVNGGRIAEIATGQRFAHVPPAPPTDLPPPGPYPAAKVAVAAISALAQAKEALAGAESLLRNQAFGKR